MSEVEIFEFPYGAFLKQRLEFVLLRDDDLQAKIMRVIEYRMIRIKSDWLERVAQAVEEGKPEPPEPDYWITLSYAQITVQLYMFNSSKAKEGKEIVEGLKNSLSRNTLGKAMRALIDDKYVLTRPNPDKTKEYDATQYRLNRPLIQEHLNRFPKEAKLPILYLANNGRLNGDPCTKFLHPPCTENLQGDAQNFYMGRKKILQGDVKNSYHLIEEEIELEKNTNRESITEDPQNTNSSPNGDILSQENILLQEQLAKRDEQIALLLEQVTQLSTRISELSTSFTQANEQTNEEANKQVPIADVTTQPSLLPEEPPQQPASTKGKSNRGRKPKQVEVPELTEEEKARLEAEKLAQEALKERHKAIFSRIVARRGYELTDQKDIIIEWTHVHKLADKFKDNQIEAIHKFLFEKHEYWSQAEHKYSIGAYIIWKQSGAVAQILRDQRLEEEKKSSQPQSISGYRNYTLNPASETGESTSVVTQQEHPGPAPRRLQIRRVADVQAALASRNNVAAVAAQ